MIGTNEMLDRFFCFFIVSEEKRKMYSKCDSTFIRSLLFWNGSMIFQTAHLLIQLNDFKTTNFFFDALHGQEEVRYIYEYSISALVRFHAPNIPRSWHSQIMINRTQIACETILALLLHTSLSFVVTIRFMILKHETITNSFVDHTRIICLVLILAISRKSFNFIRSFNSKIRLRVKRNTGDISRMMRLFGFM